MGRKTLEAEEENSGFGCCVSMSGVNRCFASEKYKVY